MDLSFNILTGKLPEIWTSPLYILAMGACQLSGSIPSSIYNITGLYDAEIAEKICGNFSEISVKFGYFIHVFTGLYVFVVASNLMTGQLPDDLSNMTTLVVRNSNFHPIFCTNQQDITQSQRILK